MYSSEVRYQKVHRAFLERYTDPEGLPARTMTDEVSFLETTPRKKIPYVIVAIPAFNEEIAIGSLVLRSRDYVDRVLVIDDGSTDRTSEISLMAGADVISHPENQGKGSAIRDAFAYANNANADILILMDGDGQHNPDEILTLIEPIISGEADMVNGSRFLEEGISHVPTYRRLGQEVLTIATNAGMNMHITDTQNGFRAFSRKTYGSFSFHQNGMAIESEMLMDAANANLKIREVPINVRYDVNGSTYNPVTHGFSVLNSVIGLIMQKRPMIFIGFPGVVTLSIGAVFCILMLNTFDVTRTIALNYTIMFMACTILGLYSILMVFSMSLGQNK